MAYKFYIDGMLLPTAPPTLTWEFPGRNETIDLADGTQYPVKFPPGLTTFSFDFELPHRQYAYANKFVPPEYYLARLEALALSMSDFYFTVTRNVYSSNHPYHGLQMFSTNMLVHINEYSVKEDANNSSDLTVSITLAKSVTKTMNVTKVNAPAVPVKPPAPPPPPPKSTTTSKTSQKTYTIKTGDTLWGIAQRYVGNGSRYTEIMAANKGLPSGNPPNYIYPGQVIILPVGW
jgi:nucleoid-associated protein YgaU